ncbi:hypothetical protein [Sulfobacillus harzensis]|uniref:Uncharacterized protein n=1 Tax=Sulfobacillus harzensis TaxID=2729629 RepID=A0A7Y0Q389_9FIRM|nr:hypothetical protein [Sulfobacillus harzensis]NMP21949.1 hypothetical protein [Sulfobacillus harzensis]
MRYAVRPYQSGDLPFLWEMLYQSIFVPDSAVAKSLRARGRDTEMPPWLPLMNMGCV